MKRALDLPGYVPRPFAWGVKEREKTFNLFPDSRAAKMLRRNVLIFHAGALGDFVLTWPLALALGRLYPQSRIIYVTQGQKGALAEKALRVEATDVEMGWHHLFGDAAALPDACRRRLEGAHSIFSFVAGSGDEWMKSVSEIAGDAEVMPLAGRPPQGYAGHASEFLVEGLASRPVVQTAVKQLLASIATQGVAVSRSKEAAGDVLIHPGSGSGEKNWPVESFLALIERLRGAGRKVRVIVGEAELDAPRGSVWSAEILKRFAKSAELVQSGTYLELLQELQQAGVFVGNDSGPSHLAGILGVPTIALFGPTNPAVWKPLGPRVAVLRGEPLATLSVDAVHDNISRVL